MTSLSEWLRATFSKLLVRSQRMLAISYTFQATGAVTENARDFLYFPSYWCGHRECWRSPILSKLLVRSQRMLAISYTFQATGAVTENAGDLLYFPSYWCGHRECWRSPILYVYFIIVTYSYNMYEHTISIVGQYIQPLYGLPVTFIYWYNKKKKLYFYTLL